MIAGLTAHALEQWSESREAQEKLPDFVRRPLAAAEGDLQYLSMPAGTAINQPGVDGRVIFHGPHLFIPEGESVWEMGCSKHPRAKANNDYRKRTEAFSEEWRRQIGHLRKRP